MKAGELKTRFSKIGTWSRSGERAPHKPFFIVRRTVRLYLGDVRKG